MIRLSVALACSSASSRFDEEEMACPMRGEVTAASATASLTASAPSALAITAASASAAPTEARLCMCVGCEVRRGESMPATHGTAKSSI